MAALKSKTSSKLRKATVDTHVVDASSFVVFSSSEETFDVMLNQTNIGQNNNKFYVIQVLKSGFDYYTWSVCLHPLVVMCEYPSYMLLLLSIFLFFKKNIHTYIHIYMHE